jgi:hypothetical protein
MTRACASIVFEWTAIVLGIAAAVLWWYSAAIPAPEFQKIRTFADQGDGSGSPMEKWAAKTARMNKWAAGVTALAIFAQALSNLFAPRTA